MNQPQNQNVDENTNLIDKNPQNQDDPEPACDKNDSLNKSMKQLESAHAFNQYEDDMVNSRTGAQTPSENNY